MLDEPPFMVRICGLAGFMDDFFVILQSERRQFRARGPVIRVKNASNPQTFRDPDKHRGILDIDYLPGWRLGDVQRKPKDVRIGLAEVDEAGGNKRIHKPVQLELSNPIRIQFPRFITDHYHFQSVLHLELADQLYHLGVRFRLREHEFSKLGRSKRPLLAEHHQTRVSLNGELAQLVSVESPAMPGFHLIRIQVERLGRQFAGPVTPSVGEQNAADIQEQCRN